MQQPDCAIEGVGREGRRLEAEIKTRETPTIRIFRMIGSLIGLTWCRRLETCLVPVRYRLGLALSTIHNCHVRHIRRTLEWLETE